MNAHPSNPRKALARAMVFLFGCAVCLATLAAPPGLKRVGTVAIMTFPDARGNNLLKHHN